MERIKHLLTDPEQDYYIYDLTTLEQRIYWLTSATKHSIYYAVKANSHPRILETLAPYVAGFEVASPGEIEKVRAVSATAPMIYGGPVKTRGNLAYALEHHVKSIQVESLYELDALQSLLADSERSVEVMLRINLSNIESSAKLKMAGVPTQFGLPYEDLEEAFEMCEATPELQLTGFHFHSMSNNLDEQAHVDFIKNAITFAQKYSLRLPADYAINVGGGIGINYEGETQFDFETFASQIENFPQLTFELGRFITAPIGYYAANVYDIKTMHGETFVLLNGGTNHFRFPKAWYHNHPLDILHVETTSSRVKSIEDQQVTLAGKLCTPNDVFGPPYSIKSLKTGDWVIFKKSGSYAYDISHLQFLSHNLPKIKFI